ncbi:unnamed protein product [marine sediment metagenome]|uniref:Uncharacterized protein n=1 Tax=marine sediment metagenome TaxID=412755 RepID=X1RJH6_9ZZZZ
MSGSTRGKLKEHFEGIHKNLDWCVHHTGTCLDLIRTQLAFGDEYIAAGNDAEKQEAVLMKNPMYQGIKALGDGISTLDELSGNIYAGF